MTVENSAHYITELNEVYPKSSDLIKEGDDHIRLLKLVLKSTFPMFNTAVEMSVDKLNLLHQLLELTDGNFKVLGNLILEDNDNTLDINNSKIINVPTPFDETSPFNVLYFKEELMKLVYPVNSLYLSVDSANPSDSFGFGTWVNYGGGRVLVGAGSTSDLNGEYRTFAVGDEGGVFSSQLETSNVFSYNNTISDSEDGKSNNMQPYTTVNIWKRTA